VRRNLFFLLLSFLFLSFTRHFVPAQSPTAATPLPPTRVPRFQHVFVLVEENQNYDKVIGNTKDLPYLNDLASHYGLATNYFANTHPSLNNYFFLTSGRNGTRAPWIGGLADEYPFPVSGENVVSVLSANDRSWKVYAEGLPRAGYIGDDRFPYIKRHNPFAYYRTVRNDASQRANIVPFDDFHHDLKGGSFPDYSFIVPNIYHDGHDDAETHRIAECGDHRALKEIDGWLKNNIDPLVTSEAFARDGLLVIVFDEGCESGSEADWRYDRDHPTVKGGGRVPAIVISSRTPPGTTSDLLYHHQSVLRLALKALGIEHAPGLASIAPDMSDFFPKPGEQPLGVGEKPAAHPEGPPH